MPVIIEETRKFADVLPGYVSALHAQLMRLAEKFGVGIPQDWDQVTSLIVERGRQFLPRIADISVRAFFSIFESTLHILSTLLYILLVPIITYYLMVSFDAIKQAIRELIPAYARDPVIQKLEEIDRVLAGFIRGQLTVCLILAVLYSLGFALIRIDLAVVLGLVSGLLFIVPYLGTMIGLIFGSLMALAKYGDWVHVLYVFGWIGLVQLLEGYVLTPRIVGHATGLRRWYIFCLLLSAETSLVCGYARSGSSDCCAAGILAAGIKAYRNSYLYSEPPHTRSNK